MKAEIQFREALQDVFGPLEFIPVGDGQLHRFHVPDDRSGSRNGWYVLHLDGIASGAFGSWKLGESSSWCSRQPADPIEAELIRQRIEAARQQRAAEQQDRHQQAAVKAAQLWGTATRASPEHPYLLARGVPSYHLRQWGRLLLVPLCHGGRLVNLQQISPDGQKRFLSGGQVRGCYSPIGSIRPGQPLYLCEGWATGATLHQLTGQPVACAMNAGNLLPAGQQLKDRHPGLALIVAGDDDRQTPGNPGRSKAMAAALALGANVLFPEWPDGCPAALTDFNDLQNWQAREVLA